LTFANTFVGKFSIKSGVDGGGRCKMWWLTNTTQIGKVR